MSKFTQYLKTRQAYTNLALAVGSFILLLLIIFFSLRFYTRHGSSIEVPKLEGLTIEQATSLLDEQGFKYQIDSTYVTDKPPGTVLSQDPDPGTQVKLNRTIYLTIVTSRTPDVVLPDIEQKPYSEVLSLIANSGLKLGDTTYRHDIARNLVLQVIYAGAPIKPGAKLPKGSRINLVLGDGAGASEVIVPDVVNQDLDAAKFVITNSGLLMGNIQYEGTVTDSTKLVVKSQSPAYVDSTSKASIGTRINLVVSQK